MTSNELGNKEYDILRVLLDGMNTKDMSASLNIPEVEINTEIRRLCRKYEVKNRVQLAVRVWTIGLEKIGKSA